MRIIFLESKKALTSPIIIGLLLLFTAWNLFIIFDSSSFNRELSIINKIAGDFGVKITDGSLSRLNEELKMELSQLNAITKKQTGKTFKDTDDFFRQLTYENQDTYTSELQRSFNDLSIKQMYLQQAESFDKRYEAINIQKIGEGQIAGYHLSGSAAEMLRKEYSKLADRFEQLKKRKEYKSWFFAGKPFAMHSLLFRTIFLHILIESLILIVLSTALISNFEFENRTQLVAFSSKRGRKLMTDKLFSSFITSTTIFFILLAATLGPYFTVFDYSHLWSSSINSGLNWEFQLPYLSWWNFSLLEYMILAIVVSYICMLLFMLFVFSLSVVLKNSYYTFILFAVIFIALFILAGFIPGSSILFIISNYNLSTLFLNPHQWWMASSGLMMFKYYEVDTLAAWTIIYAIGCYAALKTFSKQDIS
ncbi:hypothetical protein [Falsibacillus pallidus]|uniref:ABC-2 family transporter n=1 Tax=Falsibacillus pallidus TaxID=493781 RepID=A0A370GC04_9BACI|nr:hypothetical protein [Falsibacillus pallidus]RDI41352.1 hypothetical protein DFR59_1082 [Falsibacillus pallidus]